MFDWLKRKTPPPVTTTTCPANPTRGIKVSLAFKNAERAWTEEVDLVNSLAEVLRPGGYTLTTGKSWVQLESGLVLQPGFVSFQPLQKGGVQTVTTVEVSHPAGIPAGVFEFQHSTGNDARQSVAKGFEGWMQLDLPVFLDALRPKPEKCMFLEMNLPAEGATPAQKRRVVLGPVSHPLSRSAQAEPEEHPFCPCCLFTNCGEVMKPKLQDGCFYGIRLFAMRNEHGTAGADCRLNGEDWAAGKSALIEYVKSWSDRGVEFRKQYVIIQTQTA
jgi:hypothetical protein